MIDEVFLKIDSMDIMIWGAQSIALGLCKALQKFNICGSILGCVVTEKGYNPDTLNGIPVFELENLCDSLPIDVLRDVEFLMATPEDVQSDIEETLEVNGFFHYHRVTSDEYAAIMELYYASEGSFPLLRPLPIGSRKSFVRSLVAVSEVDKPMLSQANYEEWMEPVQVGAALGERTIAALRDNTGKNISGKNRNYSELTALYWLWKNRLLCEGGEHMYYGLMQYRRRLMLSADDLMRLEANGVDAVLPYPMIYEPDISVHPKRYLKETDWQALRAALQEIHPVYEEAFPEVLAQPYFYNYNIILARKPVLADYCNWLFSVLERVEELSVPKGKDRADRYIGYMGEVLETLYFMYHKDDLHIVHTGCKFLV